MYIVGVLKDLIKCLTDIFESNIGYVKHYDDLKYDETGHWKGWILFYVDVKQK